jgi:hypothetical protein
VCLRRIMLALSLVPRRDDGRRSNREFPESCPHDSAANSSGSRSYLRHGSARAHRIPVAGAPGPGLLQVCGCCQSPSLPNIWPVRSNKVEGLAKGGCNQAIPVYSTSAPSSRCHRLVRRLLWFMDAHHAHNPKPDFCLSGRCRRLGYGLCMDALGGRAILQAASQYRSLRLGAIEAARGKRRAPVVRLTWINCLGSTDLDQPSTLYFLNQACIWPHASSAASLR